MDIVKEKELPSEVLQQAAVGAGLDPESLELLGDFENHVFCGRRDDRKVILRLTSARHRSLEQLQAELDWVVFLARRNAPVVEPIPLESGNLVDEVQANDRRFFSVLFDFAPGNWPDRNDPESWNSTLFERWGELVGQLHALSTEYTVPNGRPRREDWHEEEMFQVSKYVPASDKEALDACREILKTVRELPLDSALYGITHSDLHTGNFHVHQGNLMAFDFDDCAYQWFVYDLAVIVGCVPNYENGESLESAANDFLPHFMTGYRRHFDLSPEALATLPLFLRLRDVALFTCLNKMRPRFKDDEKMLARIELFRERILQEKLPVIHRRVML